MSALSICQGLSLLSELYFSTGGAGGREYRLNE